MDAGLDAHFMPSMRKCAGSCIRIVIGVLINPCPAEPGYTLPLQTV